MRQWRLIYDLPSPGDWNMAVDEALLQSVAAGRSVPVLRIYQWSPPCLSLGYGQRSADVDFERVAALGWQVVRRPTGGKAILHTDELTYCVVMPLTDPLAAGDIVESYRRISTALQSALSSLGAPTQAEQQQSTAKSIGPVCFEVPSHYEITVGGRKLIGSAQLRRQGVLLQHGTLPLTGDLSRICDALHYDGDSARVQARQDVLRRALTLEEALGIVVSWETAAKALVNSFGNTYDLTFISSVLTAEEHVTAEDLLRQQYALESWTLRR
jgi:lipoyl(octanoyl) transferase